MRWDVAVVGAGAAGAAAAAALAPHASVLLLDRIAVPEWRIGETLPGAARRVLAALGALPRFLAANHAPAPLKVSRWGSDEAVSLDAFRDPDGVGWRLNRARFEADLRTDAVARGATVHAPARVLDAVGTALGWELRLDTGETVAAKLVIDAGGRRSRLLRGNGQRRVAADRLVCVHQRVRAKPDPTTYTQSTPDGWWYTAVLPDGWRIVAFHGDSDLPAARRIFRQSPVAAARNIPGLADAIGSADRPDGTRPGFCAAHGEARSAAGQGWLAAGDAAIALDPLSSQGLFNALVTGLEAGRAALAMLAGDKSAPAAFAGRMGSIWRAYLGHHRTYYAMERRWADAPFWARRLNATQAAPGGR